MVRWIALGGLFLFMTSCANGSGDVAIQLTDAPGPYDHVNVTVKGLSLHHAGSSGDTHAAADAPAKGNPNTPQGSDTTAADDSAWVSVDVAEQTIDLLSLQNGVTMNLGSAHVPAGSYDMLRLVVASATVTVGDTTSPLKVPSGSERGIQIKHTFDVGVGDHATLLLDFDANASVHQEGNGNYSMVPVLSVKNETHH